MRLNPPPSTTLVSDTKDGKSQRTPVWASFDMGKAVKKKKAVSEWGDSQVGVLSSLISIARTADRKNADPELLPSTPTPKIVTRPRQTSVSSQQRPWVDAWVSGASFPSATVANHSPSSSLSSIRPWQQPAPPPQLMHLTPTEVESAIDPELSRPEPTKVATSTTTTGRSEAAWKQTLPSASTIFDMAAGSQKQKTQGEKARSERGHRPSDSIISGSTWVGAVHSPWFAGDRSTIGRAR